jgi:hypothetical protein
MPSAAAVGNEDSENYRTFNDIIGDYWRLLYKFALPTFGTLAPVAWLFGESWANPLNRCLDKDYHYLLT